MRTKVLSSTFTETLPSQAGGRGEAHVLLRTGFRGSTQAVWGLPKHRLRMAFSPLRSHPPICQTLGLPLLSIPALMDRTEMRGVSGPVALEGTSHQKWASCCIKTRNGLAVNWWMGRKERLAFAGAVPTTALKLGGPQQGLSQAGGQGWKGTSLALGQGPAWLRQWENFKTPVYSARIERKIPGRTFY